MKHLTIIAALGAALTAVAPAFATPAARESQAGHHEWRQIPQFGPRANGPSRRRVWVPDARAAGCDRAAMKMDADACAHAMRAAADMSVG